MVTLHLRAISPPSPTDVMQDSWGKPTSSVLCCEIANAPGISPLEQACLERLGKTSSWFESLFPRDKIKQTHTKTRNNICKQTISNSLKMWINLMFLKEVASAIATLWATLNTGPHHLHDWHLQLDSAGLIRTLSKLLTQTYIASCLQQLWKTSLQISFIK